MDNTTNAIARMKNTIQSNGLELSLRKRVTSDALRKNSRRTKVLLLDTSSSMDAYGANGKTRMDTLWEIVQSLREDKFDFLVCEFNDKPKWNDLTTQPYPSGTTRLELALDFIKISIPQLHSITLIHDGEPYDPDECLRIAPTLAAPINVLFVGDTTDTISLEFASSLAEITHGRFASSDINASELLALQANSQARLMLAANTSDNNPIAL